MQTNKIVVGDSVRFLNSVGGGIVSRVDNKKGLIYVEDEDGFEIPVLEIECVVVPKVNMETNFPIKDFGSKSVNTIDQAFEPNILTESPKQVEIIETAEGDKLQVLLAFLPNDIKNLHNSTFDCVLINDSNYYLFYNVVIGETNLRKSIKNGIIEPNMMEDVASLKNTDFNDWENLQVQIVAFKKDKPYDYQPTIDGKIRISPLKLYKLHSFIENDYFDEPAMFLELHNLNETSADYNISAEGLKRAMFEKSSGHNPSPKPAKTVTKSDIIEIDLHIHELIDSTVGLSNADMLQIQTDKVKSVLAENKNRKGQKIVFIHGKGEGVLRSEIVKLLKTNYKTYYYQDASFQEYGFGATMVIIK